MTTTTLPGITADTLIGDIVAARPALARLFEQLHIDYCCGGRQSLAAACARRGLVPATVVAMLEAAAAVLAAGPADVDAAGMSLTELADHIEQQHHTYVQAELPRLVELAERVAHKHGGRDGRLAEVAGLARELAAEMFAHMQKEELILFPVVRRIDAGERDGFAAAIGGPIAQMEAEHEAAGSLVARLRLLTDGFTADAEACNSHRALLAGLAEFEADLHRHVHKENNVLFPRAQARLAAAG